MQSAIIYQDAFISKEFTKEKPWILLICPYNEALVGKLWHQLLENFCYLLNILGGCGSKAHIYADNQWSLPGILDLLPHQDDAFNSS